MKTRNAFALHRFAAAVLMFCFGVPGGAQEKGAVAIARGVDGFGTTARVLIIGAHPDDEDTSLIAWLALGRQVETAYLSLTRGDGGQNLIGDELGEALGAVRTEEMLAARRLDGARQYFTRAFDFGFSKDSTETFTHWPREDILGDVVKVVRAFRPHVVIAMWSGTAADGHGHHVVSGVFAREAFAHSADTARFPAERFGAAWTPAKIYQALRTNAAPGALRFNAGEFDPITGRSFADIAATSRTQHMSQGQGRLPPDGVQWNYVRREASRVNPATPAARESSMFDGIDTTWSRFSDADPSPAERALIDSLPALARAARTALNPRSPATVIPELARAVALLERARNENTCRFAVSALACSERRSDLASTIDVAHRRAREALMAAAGVSVAAFADREWLALGDTAQVSITIVNRGGAPIRARVIDGSFFLRARDTSVVTVAPDSVVAIDRAIRGSMARSAAWWIDDRAGYDFFPDLLWDADGTLGLTTTRRTPSVSGFSVAEDQRMTSAADLRMEIGGATFTHRAGPYEHRRADPVFGEMRRTLATVEAISLLFDRSLELMRADKPVDRVIRLRVRSYSTRPRTVRFQFQIPTDLRASGLPDTMTLAPLEVRDIPIRVIGSTAAGPSPMTALAIENNRAQYTAGYFTLSYDHIRPIVLKRASGLWIRGVDVAIPEGLRIGYVRGVSDDIAPILQQLDLPATIIQPDQFGSTDLKQFDVLVLGPRIYALAPALTAYNDRIQAFARDGGTVLVQYGQQEMSFPGMLPYPIAFATPPQRVTLESAPVTIVDPAARVLREPNRIVTGDFAGWMQERSLYMPSVTDAAWKKVLEMHDPDEPKNDNGLLIAPVGQGTFIYTSIAFHRQVPGGVDGAIRLFVNLLAAGVRSTTR